MWERGLSFITKAGTIILLSTIFIWFTAGYGFVDGAFGAVDNYNTSILGGIGGTISWLFAPLGFGNAKAAVATFLGLVAKENIVATFGILYGFAEVAEDGTEVWSMLAADYSKIAGYSFLVFNLLCAPCFAAIGAIKREMNSRKWTWFAVGYQTAFAYSVSLIVYQIGMAFTGNANIVGVSVAIALCAVIGFMLFRPYKEATTLTTKVNIK
jgi:ferrous iron transport protein B